MVVIPSKAEIQFHIFSKISSCSISNKHSGFPLEFIPYLIRDGNDKY